MFQKQNFSLLMWLIIGTLCWTTVPISSAQTTNLLTIGTMESGTGWTLNKQESDAQLSFEDNAGVNNSRALRVQATSMGNKGYYVLLGSSQQITLNKDEFYTVSYWARTPDAEGLPITPWIQIKDASINFPFVNLENGILTSEWKEYKFIFSYPLVSSNKAIFKFRISTPGTVYIDNVAIGPADPKDIPNDELSNDPIYSVHITTQSQTQEIPVYRNNCPLYVPGHMDMQTKDNIPLSIFQGRSINWVNFSFKDTVHVTVKVLDPERVPYQHQTVRILPSRYEIEPELNGNTVVFMLTQPGQFSVEIGENGYKNGLMIFANPLETDIPDINDPKLLILDPSETTLQGGDIPTDYTGIYFKKGEHNIGFFDIPEHIKTIYLADSAWVYGAFYKYKGKGLKIYGRGVLSQTKMNYREAHAIDIAIDSVTVEGIVVDDFKRFAVRLMGKNNRISWVKTIGGWVYNCDGITAYDNSFISNCFIWANDDAIKVYLNNVVFEDIVVWQLNNGGVIQISWGRAQAYNCRVSRVDVLHAEWVKAGFNAALFSCVGNHYKEPNRHSIQSDWVIEDIVTENPVPIIFGLNPDPSSINHIRNFTLKNWNVKMQSSTVFKNRIIAGNPNTIIDGFVFDNFVFNDVLLTQNNWLEVLDMDTSGFAPPLVLPAINKITEQAAKKFKIYPNPVKNILYIDDAQPNSAITIYHTNAVPTLQTTGNQIDVSQLHAGYYLIKVDNNKSGIFCKESN